MLQTALKVDWMLQQWGEFQRMETGVIVTTASMGKVVVSRDSGWTASISGVSWATSVCRHKNKKKSSKLFTGNLSPRNLWCCESVIAIIGQGHSQLFNYL